MSRPKGVCKTPGSGRVRGTKNKRTVVIETFAKSIIEDPTVQAVLLRQAQDGTLPPPLMALFFHYAYGRPMERVQVSGDAQRPLSITIRRA